MKATIGYSHEIGGGRMSSSPADDAPWLVHLEGLVCRFSGLGVAEDVAHMTLEEKRGLYTLLLRKAEDAAWGG